MKITEMQKEPAPIICKLEIKKVLLLVTKFKIKRKKGTEAVNVYKAIYKIPLTRSGSSARKRIKKKKGSKDNSKKIKKVTILHVMK